VSFNVTQCRRGRVDSVDNSRHVSLDFLPSPHLVGTAGILDMPHEIHQAGERRSRVRVKLARSEQNVPTTMYIVRVTKSVRIRSKGQPLIALRWILIMLVSIR